MKKSIAEMIGTFVLVLLGCGAGTGQPFDLVGNTWRCIWLSVVAMVLQ